MKSSKWICLLLSVLLLFSFSCGKSDESKKPESATPEESSQENSQTTPEEATKPQEESLKRGPDSFIQDFEQQTLYKDDNYEIIALTTHTAEATKIIDVNFINHTDKKVLISFNRVETEDGFAFLAFNAMNPLNPNLEKSENTIGVYFFPVYSIQPAVGEPLFFNEFNMGKHLGDFKFYVTIQDGESLDYLAQFETNYLKTKGSGSKADLTEVLKQPQVLDHNGIKAYHIDSCIFPKNPKYDWELDTHQVTFFYDNPLENRYDVSFRIFKVNDQEVPSSYSYGVFFPKSKGFADLSFNENFLKENNLEEIQSIEFEFTGVEKQGESSSPWDVPDTVKLEFSLPWKIRNLNE